MGERRRRCDREGATRRSRRGGSEGEGATATERAHLEARVYRLDPGGGISSRRGRTTSRRNIGASGYTDWIWTSDTCRRATGEHLVVKEGGGGGWKERGGGRNGRKPTNGQ